jgi:hypothetical protein
MDSITVEVVVDMDKDKEIMDQDSTRMPKEDTMGLSPFLKDFDWSDE